MSNSQTKDQQQQHIPSLFHPQQGWLPGTILAIVIGTVSWFTADLLPQLGIPNIGGVTIAILLGIIVGNVLTKPLTETLGPGIKYGEKQLLPIAIALLGVELQLATLQSIGLVAIVIIIASILTSFTVSILLGTRLGFSRRMSLLMGAGNGICGSSAVAATASAINADEHETGISIGVVNLLGTIGIFLMPGL
ncbi:MAG: putative sulfate exporter family transporter, partial [Chloroflexota bacterium]